MPRRGLNLGTCLCWIFWPEETRHLHRVQLRLRFLSEEGALPSRRDTQDSRPVQAHRSVGEDAGAAFRLGPRTPV